MADTIQEDCADGGVPGVYVLTVVVDHAARSRLSARLRRLRRAFRWCDEWTGRSLPERWWEHWTVSARMLIAQWVNRDPRRCWAELVMWAYGLTEWEDVTRGGETCRRDAERNGACWCGKIAEGMPFPDWRVP